MKTDRRHLEVAILAGGCFWCLESVFSETAGVVKTTVGYTGGTEENPTYEQVCSGKTRHREAIEVVFDADIIRYDEILALFWSQIDPTDTWGQFSDRGFSYTTAIWYTTIDQKNIATRSKEYLEGSHIFTVPIVTEILPKSIFYPAEEYHQKYYKKSSFRYNLYQAWSGREDFIRKSWTPEAQAYLRGKDAYFAKKYRKPENAIIQEKLSDLSYEVTQNQGTEAQYSSEFATGWKEGIYVDIVSWEPLFSSLDQYDAGCGWPSFTKPISQHFIQKFNDTRHGKVRTEVRSTYGDSHLWHLFDDGPTEEWWLRYCINGAALLFIPKEDLEKEGYAEYKDLF